MIIFKNCILFLSDLTDLSDLLIAKNSTGLIYYAVQPRIEIRTEKDIIKLLLLIENEEKVQDFIYKIKTSCTPRSHGNKKAIVIGNMDFKIFTLFRDFSV